MSSLTVLCPNAHRCKIPTTPGKLLREVFEEACMRQGYDSNNYGLQFQRKFLDLSLPIRLAGLPNNATLELLKREGINPNTNIQVALQGEFGRHIKEFPASTTLTKILEIFTPIVGTDLLCTSDEFLVPSIGYMNKLWKGIDILTKNTLQSIGMESGGKALFRYSQIRVTAEELESMRQQIAKEEANRLALMEIYNQSKAENEQREALNAKYQMEVEQRERIRNEEEQKRWEEQAKLEEQKRLEEPPTQPLPSSRVNQLENALNAVTMSLDKGNLDNLVDQIVQDNGSLRINEPLNVQPVVYAPFTDFKFPEVPIATFEDLMDSESGKLAANLKAPERRPVIFERKPITTNDEEEPEEFFEVTANEAKKMQRELSEKVKQMSQQALLPKTFVEARNKERKMLAYKHCVIRIRVEENVFVQCQFLSIESVDRLFEFVAGILKENAPKFDLSLCLNQKIERASGQTFIDAGLAPVTTLNLHFSGVKSSRTLIKTEAVRECSSEEADSISHDWLTANSIFKAEVFTVGPESEAYLKRRNREDENQSTEFKRPSSSTSAPKPKWFKQ